MTTKITKRNVYLLGKMGYFEAENETHVLVFVIQTISASLVKVDRLCTRELNLGFSSIF